MNAEKTGFLIYELRNRKGLTQKELAEQCNVTDKAVSKWERGEGCPDVTVLPKLAEVFGVEVESIMNGELPVSQDVSGKKIVRETYVSPLWKCDDQESLERIEPYGEWINQYGFV